MKYLGEYSELENNNPRLPLLDKNVSNIPHPRKDVILSYLKNKKYEDGAMPASKRDIFNNDFICGDCLSYTDGEFAWDFETVYYFEKYNMNLPEDFIRKVVN